MKSTRKAISKRVRFEVFKRDGFECQYCGNHPPKAILHIDHIVPVAEGGTNDIDNLVCSCADCNLGKSCVPLSSVPQSLKEKADEIKEREEQLRGYHEILEEKRKRIENEAWRVAKVLTPWTFTEKEGRFSRAGLMSIKKFIDHLGVYECLDAAESTFARGFTNDNSAFRYFCGICWSKIKEEQHGTR